MHRSLNLSRNPWSLRFAQRRPGLQVPQDLSCEPPNNPSGNDVVRNRMRHKVEHPICPKTHLWLLKGKENKGPKHNQYQIRSKDGHVTNRQQYSPAPGVTVAATILQTQQRFVVHLAKWGFFLGREHVNGNGWAASRAVNFMWTTLVLPFVLNEEIWQTSNNRGSTNARTGCCDIVAKHLPLENPG